MGQARWADSFPVALDFFPDGFDPVHVILLRQFTQMRCQALLLGTQPFQRTKVLTQLGDTVPCNC